MLESGRLLVLLTIVFVSQAATTAAADRSRGRTFSPLSQHIYHHHHHHHHHAHFYSAPIIQNQSTCTRNNNALHQSDIKPI